MTLQGRKTSNKCYSVNWACWKSCVYNQRCISSAKYYNSRNDKFNKNKKSVEKFSRMEAEME